MGQNPRKKLFESLPQHVGNKCEDNMKGTVVAIVATSLLTFLTSHSETLIPSTPSSSSKIENEKQRNSFKSPSYSKVEELLHYPYSPKKHVPTAFCI